ncbi:hypothetical protein GOHSU_56_00120 [Gordonia hirsuta DSM 44140 = NBRC 16056]|uniref:Protease PrsW n=1 Tax=Gordonia hirsuta DSM 44140 = NBRC 16056 TaxID=1121927 RepID=L7LD84_9ACTN|nr:PrsW family glutamic-type intramembrane protease [Gordonia hirsuta]GAC58879.1 hypothetical protein GOHSU_56_00120 [Gordonia hirsuta DSM 44140 = NBRC 16056]
MNTPTEVTWRTAGPGLRSPVVLGALAGVASLLVIVVSALDSTAAVVGIAAVETVVCAGLLALVGLLLIPRGVLTRSTAIAALYWGALVAPCLASLLSIAGAGWVIAPFLEETLKLCGVVVVLRWCGRASALRGLAIGFVVGAGFEIYENILYILMPDVPPVPGAEASGALETAAIRLVAGFGLHAMTVSITGAAVGTLIARTGRAVGKLSALALGGAILIHLIWNLGNVGGFLAVFLMIPDYVVLVVAFVIVRKRAIVASVPTGLAA